MYENLFLLPGNSNLALFKAIADTVRDTIGWPEFTLGACLVGQFSDGEPRIEIHENIRGKNVYVMQSTCDPCGQNLVELCLMVDTCVRAAAKSVTAVIPYFGLARQDRKVKSRVPISASWAANAIRQSGADQLMCIDLHAGQIQGFLRCPFDNLFARPVFLRYIEEHFDEKTRETIVVVSPDANGTERARALGRRLNNMPIAVIDKRRPGPNQSEVEHLVGDVDGRDAIIVDDIVDTAGTLIGAARALRDAGASSVRAFCTHPVLSGPAIDNLQRSGVDKLVVTDTIPLSEQKRSCEKIEVISVAPLIAEAVLRNFRGESVSALFN